MDILMPRALWKGAISFGLVHVPVELYPAAQRHTLDMDLLDRRTMAPIGYKKFNKTTGKEVAAENIVKGYEYEKGQYVVLGDEDFRRANPKATQTVEILAFVDGSEIEPMYYDTPYYLVPTKGGNKVYALLRETMKRAGCIAIAAVVIQTRQHLAAVIPGERMLMLDTLRYADEIRAIDESKLPEAGLRAAGVSQAEIDMALKLIENMTGKWEPKRYHDSYRDDLLARVKQKIKSGQTKEAAEPDEPEAPKRTAEVIDLTALLRESVRGHSGRQPAKRAKGGSEQAESGARKPGSRRAALKAVERKRA
jgi:DNA end-binding protein Ku